MKLIICHVGHGAGITNEHMTLLDLKMTRLETICKEPERKDRQERKLKKIYSSHLFTTDLNRTIDHIILYIELCWKLVLPSDKDWRQGVCNAMQTFDHEFFFYQLLSGAHLGRQLALTGIRTVCTTQCMIKPRQVGKAQWWQKFKI